MFTAGRLVGLVHRHVLNPAAQPFYGLFCRLSGFPWHADWRVFGFPILSRADHSVVSIGRRLVLRSSRGSNSIGVFQPVVLRTLLPNSRLVIGDDVGMSGSAVVAAKSIVIGNRVLLGSGALIIDNDLHPLDPMQRARSEERSGARPVVIEDDVFVGARAVILKGVVIGEGAVVGAAAVVTTSVAPFTVVAGNPARQVRQIRPS